MVESSVDEGCDAFCATMPVLQAAADALHKNDPTFIAQVITRLSTMSDQAADG